MSEDITVSQIPLEEFVTVYDSAKEFVTISYDAVKHCDDDDTVGDHNQRVQALMIMAEILGQEPQELVGLLITQ